jgi:hypothetical protein
MASYFLKQIDDELLRDMRIEAAVRGITLRQYVLETLRKATPKVKPVSQKDR